MKCEVKEQYFANSGLLPVTNTPSYWTENILCKATSTFYKASKEDYCRETYPLLCKEQELFSNFLIIRTRAGCTGASVKVKKVKRPYLTRVARDSD